MLQIEVRPSIAALRRRMLQLVPDLRREVTQETAQDAYEQALAGAERHSRSGALVRSLKIRRIGEDRYEIYHDLSVAPHAPFVHWGTKPHEIRPRNRKALRWAAGNGFVFAKVVHHPGYKGDPYLVRARTAIARQFARIAAEAWNRISR